MSLEADVKAKLAADVGMGKIATLLTGGIYTFDDTGREGISTRTTPGAFANGLLKPCVVVKCRAQIYDGGPRDVGLASYRAVVELWFYDDGDTGYTTIEAAQARAFVILDNYPIGTHSYVVRWLSNTIKDRDPELGNAAMLRTDYEVRGMI